MTSSPAPHNCAVRDEAPADAAAIAAVVTAAFGQSAEAELVAALRAAGALSLSLVAEAPDGRLVGHVAFSPVSIEGQGAGRLIGLAPLAVLPAWQGRGLGAALVDAGLARAHAAGCEMVFVVGAPAYYRRFGFRPAADLDIAWEHPVPPEAFMVRVLSGSGAGYHGVLRYHPAFNRFAA